MNRQLVLDILDKMVLESGGACANAGLPPDPLTSAQLACLASRSKKVHELLGPRLNLLGKFIVDCQHSDGHWEREGDDWHTSITGWAATSLKTFGGQYQNSIKRASRWLLERQNEDGGFDQSIDLAVAHSYSTGFACSALFFDDPERHRLAIDRGLEWLRRRQNTNGGFHDDCAVQPGPEASLSAYVWHATEAIPSASDVRSKCEKFIVDSQRLSGAWTAWFEDDDSLEGTAACLRVLLSQPDVYRSSIAKGASFIASTTNDCEYWTAVSLGFILRLLELSDAS